MQRFVNLYTGTSRLFRVVGVNHWKDSHLFFDKSSVRSNPSVFAFERYLATKSANHKDADNRPKLYKPSTAKRETHVPDDLKGGQPTDTIDTNTTGPLASGGKVWSTQGPADVHVAPLNEAHSAAFSPKFDESKQATHETTVYSTQGKVNLADPFKTHPLQPQATPGQLAEAAAASAFEPFAPDTPLASTPVAEPVFAPKISSKDIHSRTSSPTAHFETTVPGSTSTSSSQEPVKYEMSNKPKVFGGQDTSADARKHPKENPFNLKEKVQAGQAAK